MLRPGHTLYVIDAAGTKTRGKLTAITPSGLTVVDVGGISRAFNEPQIHRCSGTVTRSGTAQSSPERK